MALEQKIRSIADARVKHGLDPEDILQQADAEIAAMREDMATYTWAAQMRRANDRKTRSHRNRSGSDELPMPVEPARRGWCFVSQLTRSSI